MPFESFYATSVGLVATIIIALAATGFRMDEDRSNDESFMRSAALVLAGTSSAGTAALWALATRHHAAELMLTVICGLALAWLFLVARYFEAARSELIPDGGTGRATRVVVVGGLLVAMAAPIIGVVASLWRQLFTGS